MRSLRHFTAALTLSCSFPACSTVHVVNPADPSDLSTVEELSDNRTSRISTREGDSYNVRELRLTPEFSEYERSYWDAGEGRFSFTETEQVSTSQVESVVFTNRPAGALRGLAIGAVLGAVASFAIGHASTEGDERLGVYGWTFGGVVFGGLAGLVVGAAIPVKDHYRFANTEEADRR